MLVILNVCVFEKLTKRQKLVFIYEIRILEVRQMLGNPMEAVAWRGLAYAGFILHFVFVCQLLLLQPLVSALGLLPISSFDPFVRKFDFFFGNFQFSLM